MRRRAALAALAAVCFGRRAAAAVFCGAFALVNGAGRTVTQRDFRGKFMLLFFGYTNCPDLCPLALTKMAQCLNLLGPAAARLNAVFVSIDPARDTPALTGQYAALFSPKIIGLSGSVAQVGRMVEDFHVYVGRMNAQTGAIAHGTLFYLLDPDGGFLAALPDDLTADAMAGRLARAGVR